ncbi:DUF5723 family protein [Emticicia sp. SJ17W-69]|uniref:DUF5723 family protein n=1 Tax=Emticicia sp. SJ17W-69 TaxID=3421657 RepID=UPI003EBC5B30
MRLFFCLFLLTYATYAQQWLGISSSNYAGTYSIYSNPANVADSRYKFFLNIAGVNAEMINNYASWAAPYSFLALSSNTVADKYRGTSGLIIFKNSYFQENLGKPNSSAFAGADIRGPSMIYTFEKAKLAIGLSSRVRTLANLNNVSADIAHVIVSGTVLPNLYGQEQNNNHFALNLNAYSELGLTLGAVIREQDQTFLKVGLTVKRVNALINIHALANDIDFTITQNTQRPNRQDVFLKNAEGIFGITKIEALRSAKFSTQWLFGDLAAGTGYGFDIGAVYEFRPDFDKYDVRFKGKWLTDGSKNKYLYRIGVSLLDIGQMNFVNPKYVYETNIAASNTLVAPGTFNKIDSQNRLYNQMNAAFGLTESNYHNSFVSSLPMAFSVNIDYKLKEKIYVNAILVQGLRNSKTIGMSQPSLLAITPRFESKHLEVSLPIALINNYRNFTVGLMGRFGPLFIGTDNLGGVLNIANPKGISTYFGLFLPIFRKLPDSPNDCYVEQKTSLRQNLRNIFIKHQQRKRWKGLR